MAKTSDAASTISRIRTHYADLPPSERKLADLILDFPGELASYSATELANLAGVSKAAATRLFKRLGYASFEEARRSARREQDWGSPLYLLSQEPSLEIPDWYLRTLMERDLSNLTRTFETLDLKKLERIVGRLVDARRLWTLGYRNSFFLADYARWQFLQVRDQVHLLPSSGTTLAEQLVDLHDQDVVIAFGFRRRTRRFRQALSTIHAIGVPILYITEPSVGATINYAKWILHAEVAGSGPFDSYPAACSLVHLLSVAMMRKAGRKGRSRIQRIEEMHTALHDFD